jgi:hypothetical protein
MTIFGRMLPALTLRHGPGKTRHAPETGAGPVHGPGSPRGRRSYPGRHLDRAVAWRARFTSQPGCWAGLLIYPPGSRPPSSPAPRPPGRKRARTREGPSMHETEGPTRSRGPAAATSCSAPLPLDQLPSRYPRGVPVAQFPLRPGCPPVVPFSAVRVFYACGQGSRKGFQWAISRSFSRPQIVHNPGGSYPPAGPDSPQ